MSASESERPIALDDSRLLLQVAIIDGSSNGLMAAAHLPREFPSIKPCFPVDPRTDHWRGRGFDVRFSSGGAAVGSTWLSGDVSAEGYNSEALYSEPMHAVVRAAIPSPAATPSSPRSWRTPNGWY